MSKIDIYILKRLFMATVFVLAVLLFIFVIIDFSENSDDFTDRGATISEVFFDYYLNYVPEMARLVIPVAVFTACLFLTGQLAERLEIASLYAAGISMYRLMVPFILFGIISAITISALDSSLIPKSNAKRIEFEKKYLTKKNTSVDKGIIYRQLSPDNILQIRFYDRNLDSAHTIELYTFDNGSMVKSTKATRMTWVDSTQQWNMENVVEEVFRDSSYIKTTHTAKDTTLNIFPQDLARLSSDVYQLTYSETIDYIEAIERSGAGGIERPRVQFYGRLIYPFSMIIVLIIGFALASSSKKGSKGFNIAAGLTISFLYLTFMEVMKPFGHTGQLPPEVAATLPHISFLLVGIVLVIKARK